MLVKQNLLFALRITWADGAIDMLHYEKSIPEMFVPNILTFATEAKNFEKQQKEID